MYDQINSDLGMYAESINFRAEYVHIRDLVQKTICTAAATVVFAAGQTENYVFCQ